MVLNNDIEICWVSLVITFNIFIDFFSLKTLLSLRWWAYSDEIWSRLLNSFFSVFYHFSDVDASSVKPCNDNFIYVVFYLFITITYITYINGGIFQLSFIWGEWFGSVIIGVRSTQFWSKKYRSNTLFKYSSSIGKAAPQLQLKMSIYVYYTGCITKIGPNWNFVIFYPRLKSLQNHLFHKVMSACKKLSFLFSNMLCFLNGCGKVYISTSNVHYISKFKRKKVLHKLFLVKVKWHLKKSNLYL